VLKLFFSDVLINGTASEVLGIDSETVFRNTVNERRIVTSGKHSLKNESNHKMIDFRARFCLWKQLIFVAAWKISPWYNMLLHSLMISVGTVS